MPATRRGACWPASTSRAGSCSAGFDDDPAKQGARIAGVPVLGPLAAAPGGAWRGTATHLIVAMPALTGARAGACSTSRPGVGLPVLTVPSARELSDGRAQVNRVREVEPEDVLGREPIRLDEAGIAAGIGGRTVLVTGAGGSIGSELCRQIARYGAGAAGARRTQRVQPLPRRAGVRRALARAAAHAA